MPGKKKDKFPSELRSGPISRDWVIIATGRGKRPETFKKESKKEFVEDPETCPFCHMDKEKDKILTIFSKGKEIKNLDGDLNNWTTLVVPNKYPALVPSASLNEKSVGPYRKMDGVGYHEVVITRDHQKSLGQFTLKEVKEVMDVYHERYLNLMSQPFVKYVSIFHNHGKEAGASIFHPHSQIIASPVIDPDLGRAVSTSKEYYNKNKKIVYCEMNEWERKEKTRIVFENKEFLVVCPFVSKAAFEMIVSPKKHQPYFERVTYEEKKYLAEAMQAALHKLYKGLNNPAYNFYLHTAPCDGKNYQFYHWHFTILPKTAIMAGFELGTGIEISTIEPEAAAAFLRKQ
jgi:UDPglucose--hexose-1-phosphate uridylyltransferase